MVNLMHNKGIDIEFVKELSDDEKNLINYEFEKYASKFGIKCNYSPFNFIAKENGNIVGIITGASVYDGVYVDELIVLECYRGRGVGTKLINYVSSYCKDKKLRYVELVTNEFQAFDFYKKCGFELEFTRENKEDQNLTKYFLIKYV